MSEQRRWPAPARQPVTACLPVRPEQAGVEREAGKQTAPETASPLNRHGAGGVRGES